MLFRYHPLRFIRSHCSPATSFSLSHSPHSFAPPPPTHSSSSLPRAPHFALPALFLSRLRRLAQKVDIDTLQDWIENITFSELDREDMLHFTDDHFLKIFKLAQLTIEYLLNVQNAMVTYANTLESDCARVAREAAAVDEKMHSRAEEIVILRRELRQRRKTISTYEAMLSTGAGAAGGGRHGCGAVPGASAHVCDTCGKAFVTEQVQTRR